MAMYKRDLRKMRGGLCWRRNQGLIASENGENIVGEKTLSNFSINTKRKKGKGEKTYRPIDLMICYGFWFFFFFFLNNQKVYLVCFLCSLCSVDFFHDELCYPAR